MIALKSHGQFADMHKAFLEYDKDRSGTLDRDELAQICYRFHIGDGDPKVIQVTSCSMSYWDTCAGPKRRSITTTRHVAHGTP